MSNINTTTKITIPSTTTVAEVTAFPDEVQIVVRATDGTITPDQAREIARALLDAADRSAGLDWLEDDKGDFKLINRVPSDSQEKNNG